MRCMHAEKVTTAIIIAIYFRFEHVELIMHKEANS